MFDANLDDFVARIDRQLLRGGWEEHESAAWTTSTGGQRLGEPDFSHKCEVMLHLTRPSAEPSFPAASWWKWTAKMSSGSVSYRARGYAKSMDDGKKACERAVHLMALGVVAQFKAERSD